VDLIGSYVYGLEDWQGRRAHTYDFVMELMRRGAIRPDGLITHRFPLSDLRGAVATAMDKRSGAIKVVLMIPEAREG
jgi:threonine dehydrogenase-like Zn-dependent dehydrogenase